MELGLGGLAESPNTIPGISPSVREQRTSKMKKKTFEIYLLRATYSAIVCTGILVMQNMKRGEYLTSYSTVFLFTSLAILRSMVTEKIFMHLIVAYLSFPVVVCWVFEVEAMKGDHVSLAIGLVAIREYMGNFVASTILLSGKYNKIYRKATRIAGSLCCVIGLMSFHSPRIFPYLIWGAYLVQS